jgi:DNA repair protein RadC
VKEKKPSIPFQKKPNFRHGHRERLRARFSKGGPDLVQDYELLELILFRAITRRDVKDLAHELLRDYGDLSAVLAAPPQELLGYTGIGENVITEFKIIEAAALRFGQAKLSHRSVLQNWNALVVYCRTRMAEKKIEKFHVIFLDKQNKIIADEEMGSGTVDHTPVYPREIMKKALELSASALILVHNHPSGDPSPSQADIEMTNQLKSLAESFNIVLHDHLIIGRHAEVSFKNVGLL